MGNVLLVICLMVVCGTVCKIVSTVLDRKPKGAGRDPRELRRDIEALASQFERIEERLANLETIVVETEKKRAFERAL